MICLWSDCTSITSSLWALVVTAVMARSAGRLESQGPLKCRHEDCQYMGHDKSLPGFHYYKVEGHKIKILYQNDSKDSLMLTIVCKGASVLDSPALPSAESTKHLQQIKLHSCPLPAESSLANTLTTLNVTLCKANASNIISNQLSITELPAEPQLAAKHFTSLECLHNLEITANNNVSPDFGFLEPLKSLRALWMGNVTLPVGELDFLPSSLEDLKLLFTGIEQLPEKLGSQRALRWLKVVSKNPLEAVELPPWLDFLKLKSPATTLRLDEIPNLVNFLLENWTEELPEPLTRCDELRSMHLKAPAMRALPNGWLENCSHLEEVVIEQAHNLTALPPKLFLDTSPLKRLALKQGVLEKLSEGLLDGMYRVLDFLELDGNRLRKLPRDIQMALKLNLSWNDLDSDVLKTLTPAYSLTELDLSHNPRIGDVCNVDDGSSAIRFAPSLNKLVLSGTGVTRICSDWREGMPRLGTLDLSGTNITTLSFTDLQFTGEVRADVWLLGTPVLAVRVRRDDFDHLTDTPPSNTTLHIDSELECDCRMYWTRQALDHSPNLVHQVNELRCIGGGLLRDVSPEDMVCARQEECEVAKLPAACVCSMWAHDDTEHDPRLVRVSCENASLDRVPQLPTNSTNARFYDLHLAYNNITILYADDLQHNIKGLDLRSNSLTRVEKEAATKLNRISGVLRLAGNPLECDCDAAPLLQVLHERVITGRDLPDEAMCRNGSSMYDVPFAHCSVSEASPIVWLASVVTVIFALAFTIVTYLASPSRRFFLMAVLHRWGIAWRTVEPKEDEGRRYDAYVTFSHKDEKVVRELIKRLEPPYRLCLHYRDWIPGCFISEQVVESVRDSRRTVALVSRHFLASSWARAEFRQAHASAMLDAQPRLIVVMLEEPNVLPLDSQLQAYIKTNTYVRWGDPWFWEKLKLALPRPRPASPLLLRDPRHEGGQLPPPIETAMELLPISNIITYD